MSAAVTDARPPHAMVQILNPLLAFLLRTRAGSRLAELALVEFPGRRSGRRISVVVGWHVVDGNALVLTPASWRANFAGGVRAHVCQGGREEERLGTLELDPAAVAEALNAVLRAGASPRKLGLRVPVGHVIRADDVIRTGRAMVRFGPPLTRPDTMSSLWSEHEG